MPAVRPVIVLLLAGGCVAVAGAWLFADSLIDRGFATSAQQAAAQFRLDAVRTGLAVVAGIGAVITLTLAVRRQATAERAQRFTEQNAQEERTTALYIAAAEQLDSDKAAVRLAGLYALERLGQGAPDQRQTVVNVISAYLRMPFIPPPPCCCSTPQR